MASHLKKDPYTYEREHNAFLRELRQFHDSRGTPFRHPPRINGREVDLYALYNEMTIRGGWHKVNDTRNWDSVLQQLKLPKCPNATVALKHIYIRYLDKYEKIHFHGEDPDDDHTEKVDSRGRKVQTPASQVPMVYNHQQHDLTDTVRAQLGVSQELCPTEYDKLVLSLLSGLPNEVDFAINICTLLSNEGRHVLRLEKCPRLVELLIAHAGVWSDTNITLKSLLEDSWAKVEGRRMSEFWEDTLDDMEIRELLGPWEGKSKEVVEEDKDLFNLSRHIGVRDSEGQRVLQIAAILRNLAFEGSNAAVLASSPICLKFLLLCSHCRWSNLRQLGLDTLGSLSTEMVLEPFDDISTQLIFRTITRNLQSNDRFLVIRSLEMLIGLCQVEANEDTLVRSLNNRVYEQVCAFLTIHDIMLLVYTLESLYHITLMGREPCTCISRIHGVIGTLISFLTLDVQTYGPEACIDMKLVESSAPAAQPVGFSPSVQQHKSSSIPVSSHSQRGGSTIPIPVGYQELDNESFACNWLKATYEISTGRSVSHTDIYNEYQNVCIKLGKKGLVGPTQLANYVRSVFPHVMPRRVEGVTELVMDGIKKRMHPIPVSILAPVKSSASNSGSPRSSGTSGQLSVASIPVSPSRSLSPSSTNNSQSPILKAQLSAPPRSPSSHHPHLQKALMSRSSPPSSPVTPSKDSNSNLIKSLLANKVNQNIQRQQLLKQKTVTHPSSSVKNATPVQNASNISSGPLTLEACLAIPVSSTPTLSTATRDSIGGASLTTAFSPTATTDTVSNTVTGVTASPVKFRTNSQLGAMLGHCNPPPPLPPPTLTKELMAAQAAVKARLAEQSNSIVPSCTPSVSSGPKLTSTPPLQSHTVSPKLRINGMQRLVPVEIRGGEKIQGNANCSSESRAHVPENHISTPDLSNVNHSVSVISGGLNCESPEPEATLKTVLPSAPKLQGVPITDGNITHSSLEKPVGTTISLRLQNGTQIIASPIPSPGIQQVTHAATVPTSTTATSSNPPSIFKCHELTSAQNSGHNPFANLPPSLQPPQPPKKKGGVLADLLDGKVHKDTLFSMNGIVDRRPGDKKPISPLITNHQNEAIAKTSIVTPVAVATTIPASAPSKNCNISNGDNMVNHSSAAPRTITTTMVVAAAPISSPSLKLSIESDKANARHLGNTNGCGGKMLLVPTGGIMPINNTLRERNDDPTSKTPAQSGSTVAPNIHASGETNAKCTPNISPNARTVVNSRFAVITPPKTEELIGFPRVSMEQLKQLRQQAAGTMRIIAKRPPVDSSDASNDPAKRIRTEDIQMQGARLPVSVSSQSSSTFLTPIAPKPSTIPLCGCITNATSVITTTSAPIASVILVSTPTSVATDASGKATSLVADTSTGVVGIKSEFKWSVLNRSTLVPSSTVIVQKVKTKLASEVDKVAVAGRSPCPTVSSKCIKEEHTPSSSSPSPLAVVGTPALSANVVPPKVVADNDSSNSNMESTNVPAVPPSTVLPQPKLEFLCEWKDCKKSFESPSSVFFHACKTHTPKGNNRMPCMWENCDQMVRQRLSLMTHLQERHCNENVLRQQAMRRQELSRSGTSNIPLPAPPPPHPGYAPNAALHAIKRHALEYINSHDSLSEDENALTKSVRFTAALVLRNVIANSLVGRGLAKQYEGYLVTIAASNGDSSRTIAYCLAELGQHMEKCGT